jgi:type I restriction enzyme M protein
LLKKAILLDTDTKRRIDTARDILVGKVPDPKSQVEQITIALIYKFMDDMDAESEELGGKRKFFTGDFARFGWAKLMHAGMGGQEMLNTYAEGITKMPENPGIPALFADIFKNAYLPYRDPETLKSFLKIIDEFTYDHSERLGDAFEYLLSVLGSQGDAGQFRTPRHIIDFIVEIVAPKKGEVILDPACGTAGFLISAYKHILRNNVDAKGSASLTPDDKALLAKNVKGYDISPDMVRLSLVNLYLHGFTNPSVIEYDSLTSEERWNEYADVILANPPFMSPKGGIKPHKRFSIQAKRSEVLFVDYIAEHLTPTGRAGIIVPEGIIDRREIAYKKLRKLLVENSLVAVISLPAGCFNPYSGVKTSILILDKSLAKQSDTVAFFKVENDGFGLGAQRRAMEKNDLPQVQAELAAYLHALRSKTSTESVLSLTSTAQIVFKEKIAANGDYNLSGERYRDRTAQTGGFPWVKVELLVESITPPRKIQKTAFRTSGKFPIIDQSQERVAGWTDDESTLIHPMKPLVIFGDHTCALKLIETPFAQGADGIKILQTIELLDPCFLFHILRARPLESAGYQRHYSLLKEMEIPVPPLEVQKEIVAEIESYQKVIDGARAVLDHYRPHIPIHLDWPMVRLTEVCETITDGDHQAPPKAPRGVPFVTITNINDENQLDFTKTFFVPESYYSNLNASRKPIGGDILYTVTGSYGIPVLVPENTKFCFQRHIALIRTGPQLLNRFLLSLLASPFMLQQGHEAATGVAQKTVSLSSLRGFQIPLPPLATQQAIVAEIEAEQALVAANRELITRFEKKIHATLARVRGGEPVDTNSAAPSNPSAGVPFEAKMPENPRQIKTLASAE